MKRVLPARASLENLRKQAKSLLDAARANEPEALARIRDHHPGPRGPLGLHDTQLVLAREYGFPNWAAMKEHIEFAAADRDERIRLLVEGARKIPRDRVLTLLAQDPNLTEEPALAAVVGDLPRLTSALDAEPDLANRPTRFEGWTLLMMAAGSPLLGDPARRENVLDAISLLLARGADPNGYVPNPDFPEVRLGALYAAANMSHDREAVRLLLEAGADADDGESLFHATERDDLELLASLIDAGASIDGGVLHHALDREAPQVLRLLLERGGDPRHATSHWTDQPILHYAIRGGRSEETVKLLLDHGADPLQPGPDGRSAYLLAIWQGREDLLGLFGARGYREELGPMEVAMREGRMPEGGLPEELHRHLPDAAMGGNVEHVRRLLEAGWPVNARGENGGTAVHFAAWNGNLPMLRTILEFGPDLTLHDTQFDSPPLGWANHGATYSPFPKDDYPEVIEALAAAGAPLTLEPNHDDERINDVIRRLKEIP